MIDRLIRNLVEQTSFISEEKSELFFDLHSKILPAYTGLSQGCKIQDIEDLEKGEVTCTLIEYEFPRQEVSYSTRSYIDFVAQIISRGNVSFSFTKAGVQTTLSYNNGILFSNGKAMMVLGFERNRMNESELAHYYNEEIEVLTAEKLSGCSIFVDKELLIAPQYKSLVKELKAGFLDNLEEYRIVTNLHNAVFTPMPLEPVYKKPTDRIKFLKFLPTLLVDVVDEEEEVEEVEPEVEVKKIIEVAPTPQPEETEWVPPGFYEF